MLPAAPPTVIERWLDILQPGDERLAEAISPLAHHFADPLTEAYRAYHDLAAEEAREGRDSRTTEQMAELAAYSGELAAQVGRLDGAGFEAGLEALSSHFLCRPSALRECAVYLARDIRGTYVEFPNHTTVRAQVGRIFDVLSNSGTPAIYRAGMAYVMIIGAHPFHDANGRVARLLFNAVLVNAGMPVASFIPLKEVYRLSRGGISIRMRRALIRGEWDGILDSLTHAVCLAHRIGQGD